MLTQTAIKPCLACYNVFHIIIVTCWLKRPKAVLIKSAMLLRHIGQNVFFLQNFYIYRTWTFLLFVLDKTLFLWWNFFFHVSQNFFFCTKPFFNVFGKTFCFFCETFYFFQSKTWFYLAKNLWWPSFGETTSGETSFGVDCLCQSIPWHCQFQHWLRHWHWFFSTGWTDWQAYSHTHTQAYSHTHTCSIILKIGH